MDPKLAPYILALTGAWNPRTSTVCSAPEPEPPPGGGAPSGEGGNAPTGPPSGTETKFTQADVDRIVQGRVKGLQGQIQELTTKAARVAELETKLADLSGKLETVGKSEAERATIEAQRETQRLKAALETLQKERDEATKLGTSAREELRSFKLSNMLTEALVSAKALPAAVPAAVKLMLIDAKPRWEPSATDPNVEVPVFTVGGMDFVNDPKGAAAAYLKAQPIFAPAPTKGGSNGGTGPSLGSGGNLTDLPPEELLRLGFSSR